MTNLKKNFLDFHADNPDVFEELRHLALSLKKRGQTHYGMAALWEVMRYNFTIKHPQAVAKFPNNHRAYYARLLMLLEPKLEGFFEICVLRSGESELTLKDLKKGKSGAR